MKRISLIALPLAAIMSVSGCKSMDVNSLTNLGMESLQVMTLGDSDIKTLSDKSCAQMDAQSKVAPQNSAYSQRLDKIANVLGRDLNGTTINYKVYLTSDVNAWAMANGCVRVYSGLMDIMTDNEIEGVLGHELGHVALGHTKKAMQVAYAAQIARDAASASGIAAVTALSKSELGDLAEKVVNSQFSQSQEKAADNYSFDFLVKKNINPLGLATAFDKLGGGNASILSSHPSSSERAQNIRNKIAALKQ